MQSYPSLKVRLIVLFGVAALVPLTVFGWVLLGDRGALEDQLRSRELELEWARLERSLRQRLTSLVRRCREARLDRNPDAPAPGGPDPIDSFVILESLVRGLAIIDGEDGRVRIQRLGFALPSTFAMDEPWIVDGRRGEVSWLVTDRWGSTPAPARCFLVIPRTKPAVAVGERPPVELVLLELEPGALLAGRHVTPGKRSWLLDPAGSTPPLALHAPTLAPSQPSGVGLNELRDARLSGALHPVDIGLLDHSPGGRGVHLLVTLPRPPAGLLPDRRTTSVVVGVFVAAIVVLMVLGRLQRLLFLPLKRLRQGLDDASRTGSNLGRTLESSGAEELSALARYFNRFVAGLSSWVRELRGNSSEIRVEVNQMVQHNTALARRIGREVGDIALISEQMSSYLQKEEVLTKTIDHASDLARDGQQSTRRGEEVIGAVVASFEALLGRMREYSRDTRKLGQSVEEIYTDSRALDHIAERSSLLALNVSIEANRSDGKAHGVDVVAHEIQLLSEKTVDFTRRMRAVIGRVVEESHTLIQRLEDEEEQLLRGWSEQSQEALQALESMRDSTSALTSEVATIARLNRQQTHFAGRVRRHLKETRRLIHNIVGQVSRSNERIGSIHRLFERLDGELERLHIGADERVNEDGVDELAEVHPSSRSLQVF